MKKVAAATLGCKVNMYDTEAMLGLFKQKGYEIVDFEDIADVYIINTCTVTNLGDKKSRQMIRRARKQNSGAVIIAAGCYAQVSPEEAAKIEGVNIVTGAAERGRIVELAESCRKSDAVTIVVGDVRENHEYEELGIDGSHGRTRAYVKVEDGCDQFCSYCVIPYARGAVRSRRPDDVLNEIRRLAGNGYKEIVITGIHVASYGNDLGYKQGLAGLLRMAHEVPGIERIRLGSIDPRFAMGGFIEEIKHLPRLCDHFHLSLQSGCDKTLKAMNRKYTKAEYLRAVCALRELMPDVAVTTDIIVGFPGETDEDYEESLEFVSELELAKIHVSPFSPKKGTKAATMDGRVPERIKRERLNKMLELGETLNGKFNSRFIGRTMDVLVESRDSKESESKESGMYEGHTTNYIKVRFKSEVDVINRVTPVKITEVCGETALGIK